MNHSFVKNSVLTAAIAGFLMSAAAPSLVQAQAPAAAAPVGPAPKAADGHPDLSGVWWRGADVGARNNNAATGGRPAGQAPAATAAPTTFAGLYNPAAAAKAKTLLDKDDPTLKCASTAFGTLNVSMFDVGAIAQIVHTPKFVVFLAETYHGWQLVPTDGRPHRDTIPPSNRGDGVGHWEGDVFVVDKTNFTDTSWISAEGRVSFHSDALHIIERYRRVNANTLEVEATLEDPKVLTKPWVVPKQTLVLAPFDQIMDLVCSGTETQGLMDAAAAQQASGK